MRYDLFSPTDYRYSVDDLRPYLSEEAYIRYKLKVECALAKVLCKSKKIANEIIRAAGRVTAEEVYNEEKKVKHDIRALANCIRKKVSAKARPYVHMCATSYDIVDTANILRYKDAAKDVILPEMIRLEKIWIDLARWYKNTIQIGRTHGQHAEPITFGFAMAQYVDRWGGRILRLREASDNLVGKFSGAVGAYNASSLFFKDPEGFERAVLKELGLRPANISTQIVPPEPIADFFHAVISGFGVLANFSDDMRHLQRSEIGEVGEFFENKQVGSSTMPHKRNPINFENVKSMWKEFMPRMATVYMDQISEHQRDLTNSCSQRYLPELLVSFTGSIRRLINICSRLQIDKANMQKNFRMCENLIIAEPLYILLASLGHPDAHECVREAVRDNKPLHELARPYLNKLTPLQKSILKDPSRYTGIAAKKADKIIKLWKDAF